MILSNNLGYPRIGKNRELKFALESYWKSKTPIENLLKVADEIQLSNWRLQQEKGIDLIPSNDFSFYDHVLDTTIMLGAIPPRFHECSLSDLYGMYFAMARGIQLSDRKNIPAMEMTKWFNTNYHYIVPEITRETDFQLNTKKIVDAVNLAKSIGIETKPVVLGPVSFLLLGKSGESGFDPLDKISEILPLYKNLFVQLNTMGVSWMQLDEPFLSLDLTDLAINAYKQFFNYFYSIKETPRVILTTYFADPSDNLKLLHMSPFDGLHLDLTNLEDPAAAIKSLKHIKNLSLGVIDGRNIWRNDLDGLFALINSINEINNWENLLVSPSCSLLHVPQDIEMENGLERDVKSWFAFAAQKLDEIGSLKSSLKKNSADDKLFEINRAALKSRKTSGEESNKKSVAKYSNSLISRKSSFEKRKAIQKKVLSLPVLPTTTIGSFPQTGDVRKNRSQFEKGEKSRSDYEAFVKLKIQDAIEIQEEIGLDVLVHGEFERNDMVQYFGEKLEGFAFTEHGWVQSYGSRYVRPPIIHSFVSRPEPMTVTWAKYAQSLTSKPLKGMLTGPVTILQWSFVRDDQPRSVTCREIALAIRQELHDLEEAGIRIIQIDEPALREGLPLRKHEWNEYLRWAVECFKISSCGVKDKTQIHTHMCYSEFNDIIQAIAQMDADVISIEASRSNMELLDAFKQFNYPNDIGPGIYDIHSPNIPESDDLVALIHRALNVIPADRLWINPDCGLKTRTWEEVIPSLKAMVNAAQVVRNNLQSNK